MPFLGGLSSPAEDLLLELSVPLELSELLEPEELGSLLPSSTRFLFEPVLKSVSYQPSPFNRKAAAETSFRLPEKNF